MKEEALRDIQLEYNELFKEENNFYREMAREMGLSEARFWILYSLRTESVEPVPREIVAFTLQPKQTISSALKKLEEEGSITFAQGTDRRSKRIALTASGIALCQRTVDRVIEIELSAYKGLTEKERKEVLRLFRKYIDLLKKEKQEKLAKP